MKFPGEAAERIARSLLDDGPGTVAELGTRLGLTSAGVRRPISALVEQGLIVGTERAPLGPAPLRRRGRPSQVYSLTSRGRAALTVHYDSLAIDALRYLETVGGTQAVHDFALQRATALVEPLNVDSSCTVDELAQRLTDAGYAARIEEDNGLTVQLCQHHCPVVDVAVAYPVLCEAETEALSKALGTHVMRLATLAHGDGVCTSVIPVSALTARGPAQKTSASPSSQTDASVSPPNRKVSA